MINLASTSHHSIKTVSVILGTATDVQTTTKSLQSINDTLGSQDSYELAALVEANNGEAISLFSQLDDIKLIDSTNLSWEQRWSKAIEGASGTFVLLITSDIVLLPGWLEAAVAEFAKDTSCAAVSPSIITTNTTTLSQPPALGTGVCLLIRRDALMSGALSETRHAVESVVSLSITEDAPAPAYAGSFSGTVPAIDSNYIAPGGGAPPVATRRLASNDGASSSAAASRLHLGCGPNQIEGWTNIDGDPACAPDMVLDLRQRLPFADNSIDFIYSEHFFEHLGLEFALELMADCARVLKPNGVMRTAMPDLKSLILQYLNDFKGAEWTYEYPWLDTPARAFNMNFYEWGHQYLFDANDLSKRLQSVGFNVVHEAPWGTSAHPALCNLETRIESRLIMEASKV